MKIYMDKHSKIIDLASMRKERKKHNHKVNLKFKDWPTWKINLALKMGYPPKLFDECHKPTYH